MHGGPDAVAGEGGEVAEQGPEAVDGKALGGALPGLLGACRAGDAGGRDGRGADGFCGGRVVVVEEQGGRRAAHVPFDAAGEHAEEDVGADAIGEAVVDGPDLEVHPLEAAEGALDPAEALAGADRVFGPHLAGGHVGADHADAVERRLFGDALLVALAGEAVVGHGGLEVPADLAGAQGPVGAHGDALLAPQRAVVALRRPDDLFELDLRGREQRLSLARALGREQRVAADDRPLARTELGRGDLGQVLLVEDRQLQVAAGSEPADRRSPQRGDPPQPRGTEVLADAGVGQHPPVAGHDDPREREAPGELLDPGGHGAGVGRVALEDLGGHRTALPVAEQGEDDLKACRACRRSSQSIASQSSSAVASSVPSSSPGVSVCVSEARPR